MTVRHTLIGAFALCLAALGGWSSASRAGEFKVEEGYTSLFNGKDLTGWKLGKVILDGKTETANKKWHVTEEVIVIDGGGGGDIYTKEDFNKDFNLKLEFRAAKGADSGLFIRGPQLQVRDYPRAGPYNKAKFKDFDWNELDVTVKSGVVTTKFNGKTLTEKDELVLTVKDGRPVATLNGKTVEPTSFSHTIGAAAVCKCNGEVIEATFPVGAKGGIGLQSESGKFEFRRIRIKVMD